MNNILSYIMGIFDLLTCNIRYGSKQIHGLIFPLMCVIPCFRRDIKLWHKNGLTHADYRPIMLMTAGYKKIYRKDWPIYQSLVKRGEIDIKPEYEEMIKWI